MAKQAERAEFSGLSVICYQFAFFAVCLFAEHRGCLFFGWISVLFDNFNLYLYIAIPILYRVHGLCNTIATPRLRGSKKLIIIQYISCYL